MKLISMSFKAGCLTAVLVSGALAPAMVVAQPETATTPAGSQADYQAFGAAVEKIQFFEITATGMRMGAPYNNAAKGLTPGQQEIMAAALEREIRARRAAIIDAIQRDAITSFSHDEIARLTVICTKPGAARFSAAIVQAFQGHPEAMAAIEKDPSSLGMSEAEEGLFERFFEALTSSNAAAKEIQAALDTAMAEATTPAARAAQPTIAPDYYAFRATAEPLRLFDMFMVIVMRGVRQSDAAAAIPADKREAFYAATERELYARRDVIMDTIMRKAFTSINHNDVEGLTKIGQSASAPRLAADLVQIARDGKDVSIYDALRNDPDVTDTGFDFYLIQRYVEITADAMGEPADEYRAAIDAAAKSVAGH